MVASVANTWTTVPNFVANNGGLWCLWLGVEVVNKVFFIISSTEHTPQKLNQSWYNVDLQFDGTNLQVKTSTAWTINFGRIV